MKDLLDISDEIARARHIVALIQLLCVSHPDDDQKALSEGCQSALDRLDTALLDMTELCRSMTCDST